MNKKFVVEMKLPKKLLVWEVKEYILDALKTWWGQYHPDSPEFEIGEVRDDIKVKSYYKPRERR